MALEVTILKKFTTIITVLFCVLLLCPVNVWAAESTDGSAAVPVWLCIPFAGLLLCIAVMPLVKGEWWESHQPLVVLLWILVMAVPFAVIYGAGGMAETVLECTVNDYLTFIILFIVAQLSRQKSKIFIMN